MAERHSTEVITAIPRLDETGRRPRVFMSPPGSFGTKEYNSWRAMLNRCFNPNTKYYERYGGRGITVCDQWRRSFATFLADVGKAPSPKHSIDRIDNDGNYEPGNCRWVTQAEQNKNRSQSILLEFYGKKMTIVEWSLISQVNEVAIRGRLRSGWEPKAAVWTPVQARTKRNRLSVARQELTPTP